MVYHGVTLSFGVSIVTIQQPSWWSPGWNWKKGRFLPGSAPARATRTIRGPVRLGDYYRRNGLWNLHLHGVAPISGRPSQTGLWCVRILIWVEMGSHLFNLPGRISGKSAIAVGISKSYQFTAGLTNGFVPPIFFCTKAISY